MDRPRHLLTATEVAELLRVPPESVIEWVRGGELAALSYGRRSGHRIRVADLERFIADRAIAGDGYIGPIVNAVRTRVLH